MKLLSTDGRQYSVQPLDYVTNDTNKSKGHLLARQLLKELFPTEWILEEIPAKAGKTTLYVDFLLKGPQIVVEVQGQQHYQFTAAFHETQQDFRNSKSRDIQKRYWCEVNEFTLIELKYGEEDEWRNRLCGR